ncbi:class I SAM-dependent methyltransferase [Candidatus Micrarchaeota archaeon]|nr:class I SAM-dependent methyltransferase [Candidatus Micrarchaeota archaeon]
MTNAALDSNNENRIVPYDRQTSEVRLLRDLQDILEFDKHVKSITESWKKPIRIGSILRASELVLKNFGIEITEDNRKRLMEEANACHIMDSQEKKEFDTERDPINLLKKQQSADAMEGMSLGVAELTKEFMVSADDGKREFRICDIASGTGRCSSRIIIALSEAPQEILKRTSFHLIDYSDAVRLAKKNLENMGANIVIHPMDDDTFLKSTGLEFDVIASVGHLHRKSFISDYLEAIHSRIVPGGIFISGNWHSSVCHSPNSVYMELEKLGLDDEKLRRLDRCFGPLAKGVGRSRGKSDDPETAANEDYSEFLRKIANASEYVRYNGLNRIRIISGYITSKQLKEKLDDSGFETDSSKLRSAFPQANFPASLPFRPRPSKDTIAITLARRIK